MMPVNGINIPAPSSFGETILGDFGGMPVNPAAMGVPVPKKGKVKGFPAFLVTAVLIAVWIWQIIMIRKGVDTPLIKILNWITFGKGGLDRSIPGAIGGFIGRSAVASAFVTLLAGGARSIGAGFGRMFNSSKEYNPYARPKSRGRVRFGILGMVIALLLYWFFTGNGMFSGQVAAIAGALVSVRSIGSGSGLLYGFASKLTSVKSNGVKTKDHNRAKAMLTGVTLGFSLAALITGLYKGYGTQQKLEDLLYGGFETVQEDSASSEDNMEEFTADDTAMTEETAAADDMAMTTGTETAQVETVDEPAATDETDTDGTAGTAAAWQDMINSIDDDSTTGFLEDSTPADFAVMGGKWETLQSGEKIYTLSDGTSVHNAWVKDGDEYYYVDYTGCLMRNNYSPDGFWAGEDGSWYTSVARRTDDVAPINGAKYGPDPVMTVDILNYSDGSNYAKATITYSFGYSETYSVTPLGNSTYLLEGENDFYTGLLMSVSEDRQTLIVSGAGDTVGYTIE